MYALKRRGGDSSSGQAQQQQKDAVAELLGGKYDPDIVEEVRQYA